MRWLLLSNDINGHLEPPMPGAQEPSTPSFSSRTARHCFAYAKLTAFAGSVGAWRPVRTLSSPLRHYAFLLELNCLSKRSLNGVRDNRPPLQYRLADKTSNVLCPVPPASSIALNTSFVMTGSEAANV